jgi:NAD(P)-dependent dehydrogenase (short-subunit alcohol dehydrogenase family)
MHGAERVGNAVSSLEGVRILVVGASGGIGRAFAYHAVAGGARVCVAARRSELLHQFCTEAGGGYPIPGDVSDPGACSRIVSEAYGEMGGLDLDLYSAGAGALDPIMQADAERWRRDYDVNVIGPVLVCAAALPLLSTNGLMSFMSSTSVSETRWGMSSYTASKAALDASIRSWRIEHPDRRFQRIVVGATFPTEFGAEFDVNLLDQALTRWIADGHSMTTMETDTVGRHLAEVLATVLTHPSIDVPDIELSPRGDALS